VQICSIRPIRSPIVSQPYHNIPKSPYPIITVGAPIKIGAPQPAISPTRKAGLPPMNTVTLPIGKGVGGCGVGTNEQACKSPTTAAGIPPIVTVGTPGPVIAPGCPVISPTLAALAIRFRNVDCGFRNVGFGLRNVLIINPFRNPKSTFRNPKSR
jgi:hypothetical protein